MAQQQYWICPSEGCETASLTWPSLRWHFKGKHTGEPIPEKEEIQTTEEVPEGYRVIGQYKKGVAAPVVGKVGGEGVEPPEITPKEKIIVPSELPEDFTERVKLSLSVHSFPDRLTSQILNVLALHPETHDNPNNFANLLAHICSTYSGGATHARKISLITSEVFASLMVGEAPYAGIYRQGPQGGGYWGMPDTGGQYGYPYGGAQTRTDDPMTRWISYQMMKDAKEEEKAKETKLPAALDAELSEIKRGNQEAIGYFQSVMERLDKQDAKAEEDKRSAEIAELRAEIRALGEGKKGGESDWLQAYLTERDKRDTDKEERYQSIIKDLGDKLAGATREVSATSQGIDARIAAAITTQQTARAEAKKELEDAGYGPKTKTKEELDHEIQKTVLEIIPEKIDKGFDKIADRLVPAIGQSKTTTQPPAPPRTPQAIADQAELEAGILEGARGRK